MTLTIGNVLRSTCLLALLTATAACSSDDSSDGESGSLAVVTYNGGLALGFVQAAEARAPLTSQAVADLDADLVCVQEFWAPKDVELLGSTTKAKFPHQVFMEPDPGTTGPAACTDADLNPLATCATTNGCDKICSDELVSCVLGKCGAQFAGTPEKCRGCLQANIGKPYDAILGSCKSESTEYAFGGAFGIGILSSFPIEAQETTVLESTTNRRGIIYAKVGTKIGDVHVFCTHLTAVFKDIPYPKTPGSWQEEQRVQIQKMVELADSKASNGRVLLLGDLNTGPAGDGYLAEVPDNFQAFVDAGFSAPYVETPGTPCTFCADNPIVAGEGNDDSASVVIDHILSRGVKEAGTGERVLDQGIEVTSCGKLIPSAYSDHYGAKVTFGSR